jgi:lysophospholipase L1-like esterase
VHAAPTIPAAASTTPLIESGSGAVGSSAAYARADHVHPAASGGTGTQTVRESALRNWKKSNTSKIAAIMGRGQSGFARARILGIGDSFTAGFAAAGTSFTNGRSQSFLTHLAAAMAARGMSATADWAVGDGNSGDVPLVYDPRVGLTGGTSLLTDFRCIGGSGWTMDGVGNRISFTPANAFDTVEVLVMMNNNTGVSGNFDVFYNGSGTLAQTVTSNDILGVKKVTLTVPGGTTATSVQFQRKTNATFIAAVGTRIASKPGIEIINAGSTGTPLATYAAAPGLTTGAGDTNTWNTRAAASVLMDTNALNVTIINGWFNDKDAASTIAATQTQLANLITAAKVWGDVIYMGYAPLDPSDTTLTVYNQWQDAMYATATAADIPIIDPPAQLPLYATGIAQGMYGDPLHLNGSGHAIIARAIMEAMADIS